jgi:hypothetical protein
VTDRPLRAPEIEIERAEDGYIVYHPARDRVHYLNHTAALVLELCTGENEASGIATLMRTMYDLPEPPVGEIETCIAQLREEGLIC